MRLFFLQQLRHWSFHVTLCAIPSFIIALKSGFDRTECIVAMLLGVMTYILIWACVGTFLLRQNLSAQSYQALRWGTRARTFLSLIGLPACFYKGLFWMMYPDFCSGVLAMVLTEHIRASVRPLGLAASATEKHFLSALLPTLIEGAVLSLSLILLSLLAYVVIRFCLSPVTTANVEKKAS